MLSTKYDLDREDFCINGLDTLATPTMIREDFAKLARVSFDYPVIFHEGKVKQPEDLVTAIATYYGIDRHELGSIIHRMYVNVIRANPELLDELNSHGVDVASVEETAV